MIPQLERVPRGWRVKTVDGWHVDVRRLRLFRVLEVPEGEPRDEGRFWCYASFEAAVLAALAWSGDADTEPAGWLRRGGHRA